MTIYNPSAWEFPTPSPPKKGPIDYSRTLFDPQKREIFNIAWTCIRKHSQTRARRTVLNVSNCGYRLVALGGVFGGVLACSELPWRVIYVGLDASPEKLPLYESRDEKESYIILKPFLGGST